MEHILNGDSKVFYCVAGGVAVGCVAMLGYVHVRPKPAFCGGKGFAKSDGLTLKYWNGRGLMEVPRLMLAKRNLYASAGDFADIRVTTDSLDGYEAGNNTQLVSSFQLKVDSGEHIQSKRDRSLCCLFVCLVGLWSPLRLPHSLNRQVI